jgi:hypothetical protein
MTDEPAIPPEQSKPESKRARQRRLKRPPGRPRNPHLEFRFEPTQEQRDLVRLLAGYGVTPDRICKVIKNPDTRRPIATTTLERRFKDELECGSAEMDAVCMGMLTKKIREGNIVAMIWYMKNRMGWRDVSEVQRTNEYDVTVEIKPEDLAKELERHGLPLSVFGIDAPTLEPEPRLIEGNGSSEPRVNGAGEPEDQ